MIEFHIMRPEWLWLLLPAVVLTVLLWQQRNKRGNWNAVIAPELLQHLVGELSAGKQRNALPWILLAWIVGVVAMTGPSWEKIPQPVLQKQDALVVVLDLSYSMKSADLPPSRIDRARQKVRELLDTRVEGQTGLVAFSGDSHIVTPLTDDTPTIINLLPALHPDMMPVPGSRPSAAIQQSIELLHSAGIRQGRILLITDGVSEKERSEIKDLLRGSGIALSVLGVGTPTGAPLPMPNGGFVKDRNGAIVLPGLKAQELRSLANAVDGRYVNMSIDEADLNYLLPANLNTDSEQTLVLDRTADTWDDKGYLLLLLLLPFALALFRRGWVICTLPLSAVLLLAPAEPASAQAWDNLWLTPDQQGQRALESGDAERAAELFERPDWAGTAAYTAGDYEAASEHFADADHADALFNLGNALARQGKLDEAIAAYRESLEKKPDQQDALDNIELLEKLKKQQQEQQQQGGESGEDGEDNEQQPQDAEQPNEGSAGQQQDDQQNEGQDNAGDNGDSDTEQSDQSEQQSNTSENNPSDSQSEQEQQPRGAEPEQDTQDTTDDSSSAQQDAQDAQSDTSEERAAAMQADQQQAEEDQAMEQWLRRVPDDPSGLLRQKFRYESELRKREGKQSSDESYW